LLEIKSFDINSSDIKSTGSTRDFVVKGNKAAYFNLKITRSTDSKTYDFSTSTFTTTATELVDQIIGDSSVYNSSISFPKVTADETYTIELSPCLALGSTLNSNIQDFL